MKDSMSYRKLCGRRNTSASIGDAEQRTVSEKREQTQARVPSASIGFALIASPGY